MNSDMRAEKDKIHFCLEESERLPRGGDKHYILDFSATPKPTDCKHLLLILDLYFLNFECVHNLVIDPIKKIL